MISQHVPILGKLVVLTILFTGFVMFNYDLNHVKPKDHGKNLGPRSSCGYQNRDWPWIFIIYIWQFHDNDKFSSGQTSVRYVPKSIVYPMPKSTSKNSSKKLIKFFIYESPELDWQEFCRHDQQEYLDSLIQYTGSCNEFFYEYVGLKSNRSNRFWCYHLYSNLWHPQVTSTPTTSSFSNKLDTTRAELLTQKKLTSSSFLFFFASPATSWATLGSTLALN